MPDSSKTSVPPASSAVKNPPALSTDGHPASEASFAETAMKLGGKSDEEARRLGAVDKADEQVEELFAARYQTVNSPIHKAVWDGKAPLELFQAPPLTESAPCDAAMRRCLDVVRARKDAGTLHD